MRFNLIDRIESISDSRLVGVKFVTLAEEYLADHFPTFPVLPGVLMLEAMTQASAWLLHRRSGFAKSIAVLKEARNVKYGNFVAPGQSLRVDVEMLKTTAAGATFRGAATVEDKTAVAARIEMAYFNLAKQNPDLADVDKRLIEHHRRRWQVLTAGAAAAARLGEGGCPMTDA